ncbi:branched-chain amino acid aminotransferase, partial [Phenoliferia sp. Uapishka_3]
MSPTVVPPSANFPKPLAFDLYPTNGFAKYVWSDGKWGAVDYGASVFEGMKAFRHPDGQVRIFRPKDNSARLNHSADVVCMPEVPEATFLEGVHLAVAKNLEWVPPHADYGSSGSMYIRPLLFASGPNLILSPPSEFTFIVYVTPTGSLYGTAGSVAPAVDAFIIETFDRSAPMGVGHAKLAGNYAPTFKHSMAAKKAGFAITLHLDSKTRTNIDEFSTSNFLAIAKSSDPTQKKKLVVPTSESILKSVTTKAIIDIAESFGWEIERRVIPFKQVVDGEFEEVCACGTAAAITPIRSITYHDSSETTKKILIGDGVNAGKGFLSILQKLTGIQSGTEKDTFGWTWPAEGVDGAHA